MSLLTKFIVAGTVLETIKHSEKKDKDKKKDKKKQGINFKRR